MADDGWDVAGSDDGWQVAPAPTKRAAPSIAPSALASVGLGDAFAAKVRGVTLPGAQLQPSIETLDTADGVPLVLPNSMPAARAFNERIERDPEFLRQVAADDLDRRSRAAALGDGPKVGAPTARPTRDWGKLASDAGMTYRHMAQQGVTAMGQAPFMAVNAINTWFNEAASGLAGVFGQEIPQGQRVGMMQAPEALRRFEAETQAAQEDEMGRNASMALKYDIENRPQDLMGSLGYMAKHPGVVATDFAETVGAMTSGLVPGSTAATIIAQAVQQAAMAGRDTEAALVAKGLDPESAKAEASKAFTASLGVGLVAPRAVPSGAAFEKMIGGEASGLTGRLATRVAAPLLGETLSGAGEEGSIQAIQNKYSLDPLMQGVGGAAAQGGVLGLGMGAAPAMAEVRADALESMSQKDVKRLREQNVGNAADLVHSAVVSGATPEQVDLAVDNIAQRTGLRHDEIRKAVAERGAAQPVTPETDAGWEPVAAPETLADAVVPLAPASAAPITDLPPSVSPEIAPPLATPVSPLDGGTVATPEVAPAVESALPPEVVEAAVSPVPAVAVASTEATVAPAAPEPAAAEPAPVITTETQPEAATATIGTLDDIVTAEHGTKRFPESRTVRAMVDRHVATGNLSGLLREIATAPGVSVEEAWLANKLAPIMESLGVKLVPATADSGGAYDVKNNTVQIRQANTEVALHEPLHGATSALLTSESARSNPVVRQARAEIEALLGHLQGQIGLGGMDMSALPADLRKRLDSKAGPLSNIKELVAYGLTDPKMREFLRTLPPPPGREQASSAWEAFKDTIKTLFGATTPAQRNFLDALIESTGTLVDFAEANPQVAKLAQTTQAARIGAMNREAGGSAPQATDTPAPVPAPVVSAEPASPPAPVAPAAEPAPATPEPAAPTAPTAAEPEPVTSTKNRITDAEREARGAEEIASKPDATDEEVLSAARDRIAADPNVIESVLSRIENSLDGTISREDEAVLLAHKNALYVSRDAFANAASDQSLSQGERNRASANFDAQEAKIHAVDVALRETGARWGRFGNFRQREIKRDFSFTALESRMRAAKRRPLTIAETAKVKAVAEDIAREREAAESSDKKLGETLIHQGVEYTYEQIVAKTLADTLRGPRRRSNEKIARLKTRADAARERIRKRAGQLNSGVDPAMLADAFDIGMYHFARGAQSFADWSRKMKTELGSLYGKVEDSLPDVFKRVQAKAGEEGLATTAQTVDEAVGDVQGDNLRQRDVYNVAMAHYHAGVRGSAALMKATHESLKAKAPDLTERDVRRIFSDYGKVVFPSRADDKAALREARAIVQLEEKIADIEAGMKPLKSGPQRDKQSALVREKRAILNALLKSADTDAMTAERRDAYRAARAENLKAQIADLDDQIKTGRRPEKKGNPEPDALIDALVRERDAKRAEVRRIDSPPSTPDERYQKSRGTAMKNQLREIERRIDANDYASRPRIVKELSDENREIYGRLSAAKNRFNGMKFLAAMESRGRGAKALAKVGETMNLGRAIMTGFDLSALGRQGGVILFSHPVRALRAFAKAVTVSTSQSRIDAMDRDIAARKNGPLYQKAGLALTKSDGASLTDLEEKYMSRMLQYSEHAPDEGKAMYLARGTRNVLLAPVRASGRAFTAHLNLIRADSFDAMIDGLALDQGLPTIEEAKAIANYINVATGRGAIGRNEQVAVGLNTVFFAPKLVASRFQLLYGHNIWNSPPRVRRLVIEEYARFLSGLSVVYALGYAAAMFLCDDEDDDKPIIDFDPRSSAFGQIRFCRSYVNPTAGISQVAVFAARIISGESKSGEGKVSNLRRYWNITNGLHDMRVGLNRVGMDSLDSILPEKPDYSDPDYGARNEADVMGAFLRSKLSPVLGAGVSSVVGKDPIGRLTTPKSEAMNLFLPISGGNSVELVRGEGVAKGGVLSMLDMIGMSTLYRDPVAFKAPDYVNLSKDERAQYNKFLDATKVYTQGREEVQELANSFNSETTDPYTITDAVNKRAEELGLAGLSVQEYSVNTRAKDEFGAPKFGPRRTETGAVMLKVEDDSVIKQSTAATKAVGKVNKAIESIGDHPMTEQEMRATLKRAGVTDPVKDEDAALDALKAHRAEIQSGFLKAASDED